MKDQHFFVTGDPLIYGADVLIVLVSAGIIFVLTYFKKWKWLWREWITTVDHKKIGIMYCLASLLMLFRGGADAMLIRTQLFLPGMKFLKADHYDQIFTTHGTIMILFMATPFMIGLMNVAVPLQIGARDVAFPFLNALSFWLFFMGAMLFNISFVIGGSPNAGWSSYTPLADLGLSPGVGENYYLIALQIAGIGTTMGGINFVVTVIKNRAPGMTWLKLPLFTWSSFISSIIIVYAFPVLTIALLLLTFDRLFGAHFFTVAGGGMPMMWANLFWIWGHPEVYIVILPAFGIFSEVVSTFSRRKLFGYMAMVLSLAGIAFLSFILWVHHFFTMGAGPGVNSFFSVSTMAISIPTGIKIFNWLFTMRRGRIKLTVAMHYALAFIPCFVLGGLSGVMTAVAPADYQYHNSFFVIAHFHNVLIAGTLFGIMAGFYYWWPKMFGFILNEKIGKISFWIILVGFLATIIPQYLVGLMGMTRRMYTYTPYAGWTGMNMTASLGGFTQGIGFLLLAYNIYWSIRHSPRTHNPDPWDGRTLEWSIPSPAPKYNFAVLPQVKSIDDFWYKKKDHFYQKQEKNYQPIHMPNKTAKPFLMGTAFFIAGFGFVFEWWWMGIAGLLGVIAVLEARSYEYSKGYTIPIKEIKQTEESGKGGY